ncbi:MAG: GSCFA domain-containing protein [Paludibacteraceae bacterium]|nr:GSCFA domain-containing protein [Paludibacteraceae bacterium]
MKLHTSVDIPSSPWQIGYNDRILLLGSCFSDEIGRKMEEHNMPVTCNPFGTLYNPLSIAQAMQMTEVPELLAYDGLFHSMAHHGSFSRPTESGTREAVARSLQTMQTAIREATVIIVTFGTAWVYEMGGTVVGNCHKMPANYFTRRRLSVDEIVTAWQPVVAAYPDKHWIFTVSPIRHVKDGLHENQLSKATLLMAVEELVKCPNEPINDQMVNRLYFPSYEILLDELRDYRFYADDLVHPSSLAVNYIWERFTETFCSPHTRNQMNIENKRWKFAHHTPLHPDKR